MCVKLAVLRWCYVTYHDIPPLRGVGVGMACAWHIRSMGYQFDTPALMYHLQHDTIACFMDNQNTNFALAPLLKKRSMNLAAFNKIQLQIHFSKYVKLYFILWNYRLQEIYHTKCFLHLDTILKKKIEVKMCESFLQFSSTNWIKLPKGLQEPKKLFQCSYVS